MYDKADHENLLPKERVFRDRIVNACAPLVRTESVDVDGVTVETCTLCHSSVRRFLRENPNLLSRTPSNKISPSVLATVCLRYLQQPRYCNPLQLKDSVLCDGHKGQSIEKQHLLQYAAEYWSRHVEECQEMATFAESVDQLLTSTNFAVCLQVQSTLPSGKVLSFSDTLTWLKLISYNSRIQ